MADYYFIKKTVKNPRFVVVINCQGQPFHYQYSNLLSALFGYANHYLKKKKYGTMRFALKDLER